MPSNVFPRVLTRELPNAVRAKGIEIFDADGKRWLDGAGGALVVNVGHGDDEVVAAMSEQASKVAYVHGTQFATDALESYAAELAPLLPMDDPRVYPVSGGSEAIETALKMARAYHLARGEPDRTLVVSRRKSYHGNTIRTLQLGGREPLRKPYEPWLGPGGFVHMPEVYEYRCPLGGHPDRCAEQHVEALDRFIGQVPTAECAFLAEPIGGVTTGASVPPDGYWPGVAEVCERHGLLLIADEVMTGFGRTGTWFGIEHFGVRPDILVAGKGCASGYWPLGLAVASGEVFETIREGGFVHGFTYSHHAVGAAAGQAVLKRLRDDGLVDGVAAKGARLVGGLRDALASSPVAGDVRGIGLMAAVELVKVRGTKEPFPRTEQATERVLAAARDRGLLLYSSTGCANGTDGDLVMLGPPFTVTDAEIDELVELTAAAVGTIEA